ncbi:MAG: superoxide dismutase family protein [Candidatus Binatia bacterium]
MRVRRSVPSVGGGALTALVTSLTLALFVVSASADGPLEAEADIVGCTDPAIAGSARLREQKSDEGVKLVDVTIMVRGLSDGQHAVHIHETASCAPCSSAGGHFDPGPGSNPSPDGNHPFHSGDLVNLDSRLGYGLLQTTTTRVTLSDGPLSIFDADGSAFIIHVNPDTYCPDGAIAGCAGGGRAACGIIVPR